MLYYKYSDYLKNKYGEKVYKLPVNLPVTCPNRLDGDGCAFCAGAGTGFEAMSAAVSVTEQLTRIRQMITRKYHANKYIAYFQNYTNTFMAMELFKAYLEEAAAFPEHLHYAGGDASALWGGGTCWILRWWCDAALGRDRDRVAESTK